MKARAVKLAEGKGCRVMERKDEREGAPNRGGLNFPREGARGEDIGKEKKNNHSRKARC